MVRCIKKVSLPNIIMHKNIIKELIQFDSNAQKVAKETLEILKNNSYREQMINELKEVEKHLSALKPAKVVAENIIKTK